MAERIQISCINKDDRYSPYERIQRLGGMYNNKVWNNSLSEVIEFIEKGTYSFYTHVNGHVRNVIIATRSGAKYLKTEADNDTPDNLLSLPECK